MEHVIKKKSFHVVSLSYALTILVLFLGVSIRLLTDQTTSPPNEISDETDINWESPPCKPDNLSEAWKEITDYRMLQNSSRRIFRYKDTKWEIAFDKGECGAFGFKGKDHWHRYNPFSTNENDFYLDKQGNPTSKNKTPSHILPKCD